MGTVPGLLAENATIGVSTVAPSASHAALAVWNERGTEWSCGAALNRLVLAPPGLPAITRMPKTVAMKATRLMATVR